MVIPRHGLLSKKIQSIRQGLAGKPALWMTDDAGWLQKDENENYSEWGG